MPFPSAPRSLWASGHPEALYPLPKQAAVEPLLVIPLMKRKARFLSEMAWQVNTTTEDYVQRENKLLQCPEANARLRRGQLVTALCLHSFSNWRWSATTQRQGLPLSSRTWEGAENRGEDKALSCEGPSEAARPQTGKLPHCACTPKAPWLGLQSSASRIQTKPVLERR